MSSQAISSSAASTMSGNCSTGKRRAACALRGHALASRPPRLAPGSAPGSPLTSMTAVCRACAAISAAVAARSKPARRGATPGCTRRLAGPPSQARTRRKAQRPHRPDARAGRPTNACTTPRNCSSHDAVRRSRRSMPSKSRSPIASSSSSLFLTCQYSAIGVTPNSWPSRRMVTASSPSASAIARARSTIAARLRSAAERHLW